MTLMGLCINWNGLMTARVSFYVHLLRMEADTCESGSLVSLRLVSSLASTITFLVGIVDRSLASEQQYSSVLQPSPAPLEACLLRPLKTSTSLARNQDGLGSSSWRVLAPCSLPFCLSGEFITFRMMPRSSRSKIVHGSFAGSNSTSNRPQNMKSSA